MMKACRSHVEGPVLPEKAFSREVLIAAFQQLKMHYETLSVLLTEVEALRETLLKQNDVQFAKALRRHETNIITKAAPSEAELLACYDDIVRRIKEM
jgi:hypothetical protein